MNGTEDSIVKSSRVYSKLIQNYQVWFKNPTRRANEIGVPVVLVSTGSYSPVHLQHVQMFEQAKIRMEQMGYQCLAGFLSPSHDSYVASKLQRSGFISSFHRLNMIELAVEGSSWLSAHPWEASQETFVDFGPTLFEIRSQIHKLLGNSHVQVRYLCGMDHAIKCGLLSNTGQRLGVVVLARPGSEPSARRFDRERYQQEGMIILEDEYLYRLGSVVHLFR